MSHKAAKETGASPIIDVHVAIRQVIFMRLATWISLVITSLLVLFLAAFFTKSAYEAHEVRSRQYEILRSIHIGSELQSSLEQLDPFSELHSTGHVLGMKKVLVVGREYAVEMLGDSSGRIAYYSVLSCSQDFQPSFDAPDGEVIYLQSAPLSRAVSGGDSRFLHYQPGLTGSSTDQLFELPQENGSAGNPSYTVGFNGACGPTYEAGLSEPYIGAPSDVPASLWKFRQTYAANFYTELAVEGIRFMDDGSTIRVTGPGAEDVEYLDLRASIYHKSLPVDFVNFRNGTRKF